MNQRSLPTYIETFLIMKDKLDDCKEEKQDNLLLWGIMLVF